MEKSRKIKIMSIVALVLAVASMTLGFAAFSKVLTITSSAKVTPNEDDFVMKVYGFTDSKYIDNYLYSNNFDSSHLSDTFSSPFLFNNNQATNASIDNENFIISNLSWSTSTQGDVARYFFVIKNEGKYDSYVMPLNPETIGQAQCFVSEGSTATETDTNYVCDNIRLDVAGYYFDSSKSTWPTIAESEFPFKIEAGENIMLTMHFLYSGQESLPDAVDISFNPIQLRFSTSSSIE